MKFSQWNRTTLAGAPPSAGRRRSPLPRPQRLKSVPKASSYREEDNGGGPAKFGRRTAELLPKQWRSGGGGRRRRLHMQSSGRHRRSVRPLFITKPIPIEIRFRDEQVSFYLQTRLSIREVEFWSWTEKEVSVRPPPPPSSGSCSSTARFLANPNGEEVEEEEKNRMPEFGFNQTVESPPIAVEMSNPNAEAEIATAGARRDEASLRRD